MKIALIYDVEYPERYPFTEHSYILNNLPQFIEVDEYNQLNIMDFLNALKHTIQ